jgi:hypothetical protein
MSPLANAFIRPNQDLPMEPYYPLHVYVCGECLLVQLEEYASPDKIFTDYVYFSSYSDTWLAHCARYVENIIPRLGLAPGARVIEIASMTVRSSACSSATTSMSLASNRPPTLRKSQ